MALYRCFHCPEESQNFPFRGYGFKDPAPAFKGEVSSGDPPQSFSGVPSYTPSPYSSPDLGVDIIKCFFRHDVSVIGSPSPDYILPLYFLTFCPKKSKPLSICVIAVFSSDSSSPRSRMKAAISGLTSFSSNSRELPEQMKSSAYLT